MPRSRSNLNLLALMQDEYDVGQAQSYRAQSLGLREQGLEQRADIQDQTLALRQQQLESQEAAQGFREEHIQQMQEIAQKAAELHDQQISTNIAQEQAKMDTMLRAQKEQADAWKAVSGLEPKTPDYPARTAVIASEYPSAFADNTDSGLREHIASLDKSHEIWSTMSQKAAEAQAQQAYGTGPEREKYATILGNVAQFKSASESETDPDKKAGYTAQYQGAQAMEAEFRRQFPNVAGGSTDVPGGTDSSTPAPAASATPAPAATPAPRNRTPLDQILPPGQ